MKRFTKGLVVALCALTTMLLTSAVTGCSSKDDKCQHDYGKAATQVVKDSTCMENGEELWTCGKCGEEKIVKTEKKEHNLDDGVVAKEPTCTETGSMVYHCMTTDCKYTKTEKIEKTAHVRVDVAAVAATCTEAGATAYAYCQDCKTYLVPKTILSALGHQNKVLAEVKATCTLDGLTQGTQCVLCNEVTKAQVKIPATGHSEVIDPYVAPTCGGGLTQGSHCGKCGEVLQAQTEIAGNNNHVNTATRPAIDATCTSVGMTASTYCLACGETISGGVEIPKLSHNIVNGYCTVCDMHEHSIVTKNAVAATCTNPGKTVGRYCSICGEVFAEQIIIPALGHGETYQSDEAVEPTCTKNGSTVELSCIRCDGVLQASTVIPATGHKFENGELACVNCGYEHTHTYNGTTCTLCGHEHTHTYSSNGINSPYCYICRKECEHNYVKVEDENGAMAKCSICGDECEHVYFNYQEECSKCGIAHEHEYYDWHYSGTTCYYCGYDKKYEN